MRRKMRRLLNEKVKPAPVNLCQPCRRLRYDVGRARTVVNQCHLTKECARGRSLEDKITKENIDFPLQQDVHLVAFLPFLEQEIARSKLDRVTVLTEKLCRIHRHISSDSAAIECTTIMPSYICVTADCPPQSTKFFVSFTSFMFNSLCHSEESRETSKFHV